MPGDLMAAHPLAFAFLSQFLVECKHAKKIMLDQYIFDRTHKTWLSKVIKKCEKEAKTAKLRWMIIACQNFKPPLVLLDGSSGSIAMELTDKIYFHRFHNDTVFCCTLEDFCSHVKTDVFLRRLKGRKRI